MEDIFVFIMMAVILIGMVAVQHKVYNKGGLYKFWTILFWIFSFYLVLTQFQFRGIIFASTILSMIAVFFTRNSQKELNDNNNSDVTVVNMTKEEHVHLH